jgi:hypothetical protein
MKLKILFLDDNQKELEKYTHLFNTNPFAKSNFDFYTLQINTLDISHLKLDFRPDLLLIDFLFDLPGGEETFYDGYSLSTSLRNIYNDIPIILFTRKDIFNIQRFPKNIIEIVDDIFYKTEFLQSEMEYYIDIHSLATGYKSLIEVKEKNWESLLTLLKSPTEDELSLLGSKKPIMNQGKWSVIDSANWVRKILLRFPGILYDELHASTYLGISNNALLEIQDLFGDAIYSGIFQSKKKYYWKSILRNISIDLMNNQSINLPINIGFSLAYEKKTGKKLDPSLCVYSNEINADRVCYILDKPVKTKYSFTYNIDDRPDVMDPARVSWKAIQITDEVNEDFLNPLAKEMLPAIKAKKEK